MANTQSPQSPSQSQSQSQKNRPMNGGQDRSAKSEMDKTPVRTGQQGQQEQKSETDMKSIGAVIGESIGKNAQEKVDEAFSQATQYFDGVKTYLRESPREAVGLGLTVAAVGWALLYTKPGRQLFDKGASAYGPQISKTVSDLFSGTFKSATGSNQSL